MEVSITMHKQKIAIAKHKFNLKVDGIIATQCKTRSLHPVRQGLFDLARAGIKAKNAKQR